MMRILAALIFISSALILGFVALVHATGADGYLKYLPGPQVPDAEGYGPVPEAQQGWSPGFRSTSDRRVRVYMHDLAFDFPANFLTDPVRPGSRLGGYGVLMNAVLIDGQLVPRLPDNLDEFYTVPNGMDKRVNLLIQDPRGSCVPDVEHFFNTSSKGPMAERSDYRRGKDQYGLEVWHHVEPSPRSSSANRPDIMAPLGEARRTAAIRCSSKPADYQGTMLPGCQMHFTAAHQWVKASFHKRFLPQWRSIRDGAKQMIEGSLVSGYCTVSPRRAVFYPSSSSDRFYPLEHITGEAGERISQPAAD